MNPPAGAVLALLRLQCLAAGADVCDRCGDVIWPEFELVRCDACVGRHGAPSIEVLLGAQKKHARRIASADREAREDLGGCQEGRGES